MIRIPRFPRVLVLSVAVAVVGCSDGDDGDDDGAASSPAGDDGADGGDDDNGGDAGAPDNVAACQDLKADLTCGGVDYGAQIDCSMYADLTCDVSPYLECLDENFTCEGDTFDATAWNGCTAQLQDLLADC